MLSIIIIPSAPLINHSVRKMIEWSGSSLAESRRSQEKEEDLVFTWLVRAGGRVGRILGYKTRLYRGSGKWWWCWLGKKKPGLEIISHFTLLRLLLEVVMMWSSPRWVRQNLSKVPLITGYLVFSPCTSPL